MKTKLKNVILTVLRYAPLAVCIVFMFIYLFSGKDLSAEDLLNFAPEKPLFAALFLIALYAFKSLTVFFPLIVLNILGGFLFDPLPALIINMIGMVVELTVPYWIGRLSGASYAEKLYQKHPKIATLIGDNSGNHFFISFFLRVISCLPGDAVSLYFGAVKMPYLTCLIGSFLGTLPGLVATTLLGTSITDPNSPMFWISIGLTVGLSVLSVIIYYFWNKRKNKAKEVENEE